MSLDDDKIRLIMELRREGITDTVVLGAIERVPREQFVPENLIDQAYANTALPIGHDQTISQPSVVAAMTVKLDVGSRMKVLEIGTGSGYQTAVLSPLCRRLYTMERNRQLLREAEARFKALGLTNVVTWHGDGSKGWSNQAPFDRIIVTAAPSEVPTALVEQLAVGGKMVIPVGDAIPGQDLLCITRTVDGSITEQMFPVRFVPLIADGPVGDLAG
ncbi:MAG: protein-L-isoaspartate(D-aspartate) O-methyltransferase [Alphaproteobacteria bacterium]